MNHGRQLVVFGLASVLLVSTGCAKKKSQLPAQAKAPAEPIAMPLPDEISETAPPPPPPQPQPQPPAPEETVAKPPKRHGGKKKITTTAPPASLQAANPPATDASNNNTVAMAHPPEITSDPAIAADVSNAQLAHQKQSTALLLDETEKAISGLKGLSHDQEEMVTQIRSIVNQSRKATSDGDFERAYNLATKAHLLSDALVKK
jgi:hypothetical protein